MNKFLSYPALLLALSLLLYSCGNSNEEETATEPPVTSVTSDDNHEAKQLPQFKMMNEAGEVVELSSFTGKKIFLNLWASWCPPCRKEMPSIQKLYKSIDTSKAVFIMLALDDSFEKSVSYSKSKKLNLPLYYPAENLPAIFNVSGIPVTYIFNENGQVIHKTEGSDNYDRQDYRKLLQ